MDMFPEAFSSSYLLPPPASITDADAGISFGEVSLPLVLWYCGPQCPSLPLEPVAETHTWAKLGPCELEEIFRSALRPLPTPPWSNALGSGPQTEGSEFLKS